jgi:hypothetical protein
LAKATEKNLESPSIAIVCNSVKFTGEEKRDASGSALNMRKEAKRTTDLGNPIV